MKLYWRPGKISRPSLIVLALLSMTFMLVIETSKVEIRQRWYDEKVRAVKLQAGAMEAIKKEKLRIRKTLDPFADPAKTGLIGTNLSPITSVIGYLAAKQTSVNPNFAAVFVQLMKRLKLEEGDRVAIGASSSFPALNLATLVACKVLKLRCVMINSVSASMYGATDPRLTWLDMEKIAFREGYIDTRTAAASIGGMDDNGEQLSKRGIKLILKAIKRNGIRLIREGSLKANIGARMRVYEEEAQGEPYAAYVNLGGSEASVGSHFTKVMFKPGINRRLPRKPIPDDGAMTLMMKKFGIPLLHISGVSHIAERYGLPRAPQKMPDLAKGPLFYNTEYNLALVWILLLVLVISSFLIVHFDIGNIFRGAPRKTDERGTEGPPGS
ncbi:MAG: poly-gamma-glutamate system protein [Deltaproteobacteria bacterium]|nr:poly-gamma-glutamate system protein [Deltaproteobacteria bacterium]